MKKSLLLMALCLVLGGCQGVPQATNIDFDNLDENTFNPTSPSGELGSFDLISPHNGIQVDEITTFSWNASTNAETYTLEICSDYRFISNISSIEYYSRKNITSTSFSINSVFGQKNIDYYWRVTAVNKDGTKQSDSTFTFFLRAPEVEEVEFDLGDPDDWSLHQLGSYADISIDNSDFFGNGKESLVISFDQEHTNQGIIESDGWIIVTKTIEKSIYGTDSMMFNMYYSGQDANIFIRLVDRDNEYWYSPIQISNNAKQTVFLRFEDFIQRTKDVPVANETFDYERIKYMEIVFEKSFGDGVLLLSDVRAIKFENYSNRFIKDLDYTEYGEDLWTYEAYDFEKEITSDALTINYYGGSVEDKPHINGYGFAKLNANRYLYSGDCIKVSVKYSGNKGTNAIIRIYEEDTDRWAYRIPFSVLSTDEYTDFVIPFKAFAKSDIYGDGRRQFYYILNLQFGLEGQYGTGSLSFKDLSIVNKKDYIVEDERIVSGDGMIENFDNYKASANLYFIWQTSEINKDEYMALDSTLKFGGTNNPYCGQFEYKSDMEPAEYTIPISSTGQFDAISLWLKDNSTKSGDSRVAYLNSVAPTVQIIINLTSGERYVYAIEDLDRVWREYTVPYDLFELTNEDDLAYLPVPITTSIIKDVSVSMHFYYHDSQGKAVPLYTNNNSVLVDNIKLTTASSYSRVTIEKILSMKDDLAILDTFESYETDNDVNTYWNYGKDYDYHLSTLSNDTSSEGGNHSIRLQYQSLSESVSYFTAPAVDADVRTKALRISMKGDGKATVYINVYLKVGTNTVQYRYTINTASSQWTEYTIGLDWWTVVEGQSSRTFMDDDLVKMTKFTIGATYSGDSEATLRYLYFDNIIFDNTDNVDFDTKTVRVI